MMRLRRWGLAVWAVAAALAAAPSVGLARSFVVIRGADGSWTLLDPSTVEPAPGGVVRRVWTVTVQPNILSGSPPQPGYVRTLNELDCERHESRWTTFSAYSRAGDLLVTQENRIASWRTPREAQAQAVMEVVCDGSPGESVIAAPSLAAAVLALMKSFDPRPAPKPGVKTAPKPGT